MTTSLNEIYSPLIYSLQNCIIIIMKDSEQILLNKLANAVKIRRNELNISQEKLAEICNFDRTYISLIERAKRNPTYLNLEKLCTGLDIKLYKLLENIDE